MEGAGRLDPTGGGKAMNAIFKLLRDVLIAGFAEQGMQVRVMQSYTGVSTGPPAVPAIIMHHIATERVGWQSHQLRADAGNPVLIEKQNVAETIQFNAVLPEVNPEDETIDTLSAQGVLTMASMILQSHRMILAVKAEGMGVQVVRSITSNYIQNESEQWENVPSFDLVICHKLTLTHDVGVVEEITSGIYRV
ncbi:Uncharacterised protein [Buttiauxella agrestis]|uniref:Uncharacterized protein n=1 Tax=Buttiauxella agrestis TaxID=82977 RepID=A0A381C6K8_9ENTR|nr:hypothetical protein [Buttiauxella agrestis]SUW63477.1 Uncharacterised protein [Buttiauxella agrestis]